MRLSAKILKNVTSVNSWEYANQAHAQEGQANTIYIQLVDLDRSVSLAAEKSFAVPEMPIRYIPQGTVVTASATLPALDDDEQFTTAGAQPFPDDKSIWRFNLTASQVPSSGYMKITLIEDGVTRTFLIKNAITVDTLEIGSC